jgi:hypothetical protein
MPLTSEQMIAATAAQRLMADDALTSLLNRIVSESAEKAVFLDDATEREVNRQLVLAIARVRGQLQANADLPESVKAADQQAKAFE